MSGGRQGVQQHPAVFGDHAVQLIGEIGPQVCIAGESRLDQNARAIGENGPVLPRENVLPAAAVAEKFP